MTHSPTPLIVITTTALVLLGCGDAEHPHEHNEGEVITTVVLSFTPDSGGTPMEFVWADPENDGDPAVDPIALSDAEDYSLSVAFLNELETPPEDITGEVESEGDEHQVFFTGSALDDGLLGYAYDDADDNGYPVGLEGLVTTEALGTGELTITLRHLPPESDTPVKTGTLADDLAAGGLGTLPGDTDAQVSFSVEVQ